MPSDWSLTLQHTEPSFLLLLSMKWINGHGNNRLRHQPQCGLIVKSPETKDSGLGKKGRGTMWPVCKLWLSEGRPSLDPHTRVGDGVNPTVLPMSSTKRVHWVTWALLYNILLSISLLSYIVYCTCTTANIPRIVNLLSLLSSWRVGVCTTCHNVGWFTAPSWVMSRGVEQRSAPSRRDKTQLIVSNPLDSTKKLFPIIKVERFHWFQGLVERCIPVELFRQRVTND